MQEEVADSEVVLIPQASGYAKQDNVCELPFFNPRCRYFKPYI